MTNYWEKPVVDEQESYVTVVIIKNNIGDQRFDSLVGKRGTIEYEYTGEHYMVIIDGFEYMCHKSEIEVVDV